MPDSAHAVRFHRVLRAPPERVYRAFLDPDALAEMAAAARVHRQGAAHRRVGGGYRMSFTNFCTGSSHSFSARYIELTPHQRIRYTDRFDDPAMPGEMPVTISLRELACGTEITTCRRYRRRFPVELCYLGWQGSLALLAHLVEAEIPDGA